MIMGISYDEYCEKCKINPEVEQAFVNADGDVTVALRKLSEARDWIDQAGDECNDPKMDEWFTEIYGAIEDLESDLRSGMKRWKEEIA